MKMTKNTSLASHPRNSHFKTMETTTKMDPDSGGGSSGGLDRKMISQRMMNPKDLTRSLTDDGVGGENTLLLHRGKEVTLVTRKGRQSWCMSKNLEKFSNEGTTLLHETSLKCIALQMARALPCRRHEQAAEHGFFLLSCTCVQ
uniref:Uncharacterized protein n=2 Tax=Lotharella globosa TaxID=91324 RepID=A0A7S4DKF4_9EUKA